jgi:uncharacterized membrane protein
MYDEEKFAQIEQSQESLGRALAAEFGGEVISGLFELLLDTEVALVCGVVALLILGVWVIIRLILEGFSGGPPQSLFG